MVFQWSGPCAQSMRRLLSFETVFSFVEIRFLVTALMYSKFNLLTEHVWTRARLRRIVNHLTSPLFSLFFFLLFFVSLCLFFRPSVVLLFPMLTLFCLAFCLPLVVVCGWHCLFCSSVLFLFLLFSSVTF